MEGGDTKGTGRRLLASTRPRLLSPQLRELPSSGLGTLEVYCYLTQSESDDNLD